MMFERDSLVLWKNLPDAGPAYFLRESGDYGEIEYADGFGETERVWTRLDELGSVCLACEYEAGCPEHDAKRQL